ncbi:hypothetical protein [Nocardioides sp. SYSU D00065]|uniref:hypothetical protein n=1 Tax=Nocardioides sp. SYSU D00065 TaxID=2817378 RepID=UPI001B33332F|nr:hypothetical protein [Nocardioides sp. SYSU D00065]
MVALVAVFLVRDGRHEVDTGPLDVRRASPGDAAAVLSAFAAAVGDRDPDALAALAPSGDDQAARVLAGVARNVEAAHLTGVGARYVDQVGVVAADGSWSGVVEMTWQVDGFDRMPSAADVIVDFAPDGADLAIAGFGGTEPGSRTPLWLHGELAVATAPGVLVMVDGSAAAAEVVARRAVRGVAVVRRVLSGWTTPVVVEVPGSAADLDAALGADPGTYAGVAAVTATAGSSTDPGAPVHVFVNPEVTAGLRRAGAQVVMSHELVHVATDAVRTPMEPWLLEGFADYVALRGTRLPDPVTLGRAIAAARRNGVPRTLPTAADFDTRARDLQARYEEAWLACRVIAERLGERGLVGVYRDAAAGQHITSALARAGLSERALTWTWRNRLAGFVVDALQ